MRIAVTGGTGRVGRFIVERALERGHEVVSIDRAQPGEQETDAGLTRVEADITDYDAMEAALRGCDGVIHMAAIPSPGRHPDHIVHNNNVVGSYNVLRAAAELGIERVCQASSVNAVGAAYSRWPRFDYFPLDERHPTYNEDPYSLSKWICEQQGDSFARRYDGMTIASMRFHWVVPDRETAARHNRDLGGVLAKHLWGYTRLEAAARACIGSLTADFSGHEAFFIIAPDTTTDTPSLELAARYFPGVPLRGDLSDNRGFFNCEKAEQLLDWKHDEH